ncbi:MAG: DEAD/DEAH box helicase family protein, partial [Pseudomonadota bacterium]
MQLREYQELFVNNIAIELTNHRKIVAQLATGGGKTICFSAICERYIKKSGKSVLILVHRKELLKQAVHSLSKANQINAQVVIAGMRTIPEAPVYVAMIETAFRRLEQFKNIGMIIIDESHLGNFTKVIDFFNEQFIIGFTATPLAAKKDAPLKKFFDSIVCGVDIAELIKSGNLCNEITFKPAVEVNRSELKMKMGEFDEKTMAIEFSNPKYINSTVDAYRKYSEGSKTIIYNCNIEHSQLVTNAFIRAGYNCKHIDGESSDRDKILEWFDCTPDAILCNVGIATTGFDQPDIETVIVNKATASMPLWLQMCGRGARPHPIKLIFKIIDMGGNAMTHGLWSSPKNWKDLFYNPPKKGNGVAPIKDCPSCGAMIHVRCLACPHCDYEFPKKELEEDFISDFIAVSNMIDVTDMIEKNKNYKDYYTLFKISHYLAINSKYTTPKMNDEIFDFILNKNFELARQWCKQKNKKWNDFHSDLVKSSLIKELQKIK